MSSIFLVIFLPKCIVCSQVFMDSVDTRYNAHGGTKSTPDRMSVRPNCK